MSRTRIEVNARTGELTVIPFSAQEEAAADAAKVIEDQAQAAVAVDLQRVAAIKANARRLALVAAIQGADDAQLLTYVQTHTTTNADTRQLLGDMALLIAGVIRS